jgi:hypothetical protein
LIEPPGTNVRDRNPGAGGKRDLSKMRTHGELLRALTSAAPLAKLLSTISPPRVLVVDPASNRSKRNRVHLLADGRAHLRGTVCDG